MLKKLSIKNYALIDEINLEFGPGLNILTGETGAGKSIIIGALGLLLGEKIKTDIIRQGASMAVVEGTFELPSSLKQEIEKNQIEISNCEILLRREVHQSGRSRCFANDSSISNSTLSLLGDLLVDLHGQHDHQTLLKIDRQLDYLDNFGIDSDLREQVRDSFIQFRSLNQELKNLQQKEVLLQDKRELLEFQVKEIERADPKDGEEEELELEERILRNSEKIFQTSQQMTDLLYEGEGSVSEKLSAAESELTGLINVDTQFEKWLKDCESARITIEEVIKGLHEYVSKVEFNPQRLEEVRERLGLFSRIKKKHGGSIEQVIEFWDNAKKELNQLETMGNEIDNVKTALREENIKLSQLCMELSTTRKQTAIDLEKKTISALEELGLKNSIFQILFRYKENPQGHVQIDNQNYAVSANGIDRAEFIISLNPGEDPKPLMDVASGGEISRIMLALKTVLADSDEIPVLIFDEIDTGISGRIARVVGRNLKEVSNKRQVICITHLPQIASMGDLHFCVEKEIKENRTRTTVRHLRNSERVIEIAKLLGGDKVTDSTIQSARELLDK